jgi:hypothetical protein
LLHRTTRLGPASSSVLPPRKPDRPRNQKTSPPPHLARRSTPAQLTH